jgi:hypothetical protein
MSKQASRIFQEMALIEELMHRRIDEDDPTGDEYLDEQLRRILHEDVPAKADNFVQCLYMIVCDMTFSDWQDFWLDMGIRIFDAEEEWHTGISEITDMEDPYEEDAVNGCLI